MSKMKTQDDIPDFERYWDLTPDSPDELLREEDAFYRRIAKERGDPLWRYHDLKNEAKRLIHKRAFDSTRIYARGITLKDEFKLNLKKLIEYLRSCPIDENPNREKPLFD